MLTWLLRPGVFAPAANAQRVQNPHGFSVLVRSCARTDQCRPDIQQFDAYSAHNHQEQRKVVTAGCSSASAPPTTRKEGTKGPINSRHNYQTRDSPWEQCCHASSSSCTSMAIAPSCLSFSSPKFELCCTISCFWPQCQTFAARLSCSPGEWRTKPSSRLCAGWGCKSHDGEVYGRSLAFKLEAWFISSRISNAILKPLSTLGQDLAISPNYLNQRKLKNLLWLTIVVRWMDHTSFSYFLIRFPDVTLNRDDNDEFEGQWNLPSVLARSLSVVCSPNWA